MFLQVRSVKHDRVFRPYTTGTQIKILHKDRWEESTDNTSTQQSKGTDSRANVYDGRPDYATKCETLKCMIIISSQDSTKGDTRTRSGWVDCRLERLGIDT